MDKKFKRYKVDYAAAYRHYIDFDGGRTLEKFCQDEGYDFETVLQNGDVEVSNNLCEQMMKHIKMNLKNCLNIGSEESALDYAFMFSALESCDINHLSPESYFKGLISGLHNKKVEKKQLLPCYIGL